MMGKFKEISALLGNTTMRTAKILWEVVCWLIIPAVFGFFCYVSVTKKVEITVMHICLAAMALSPWVLRLLSRYLSEFAIGPKGVSGKTREAVKNKDEIDGKETENRFTTLLPQTKKVLRTLWKYQVEQFGPDDIRRWGFTVGQGGPEYNDFSLGVLELGRHHFVGVDLKGFAFLTNSGVEYCKKHNDAISKYPDYYSNFSN